LGLVGMVSGDPDLGPLADNGGPTQTMALMPGSPAIAAGSAALEVDAQGHPLTVDQRGHTLDTPVPDIGAFQTPPRIPLTFSGLTSPTITYGTSSVTLTGTLSGGNQSPPGTEVVAISLDGDMQTAAIGAGGAFSVAFNPGALHASSTPYAVTYRYAGDATFAPASAAGNLTVVRAVPTVVAVDDGGPYDGIPYAARATYPGAGGQPIDGPSLEGVDPSFDYYAGGAAAGTPLGGAPTDPGTYTVVASFPGSTDYAPVASAPVTFTITRATSDWRLGSPGADSESSSEGPVVIPTVYGQPINLGAAGSTVIPGGGSSGVATVTFSDDGTVLGTVTLHGEYTASLTTPALSVGAHTITATFSGDDLYQPATSNTIDVTVAPAATQVVVTTRLLSHKKERASVGLAVAVVPIAPGSGVPTGTVIFEATAPGKGKKAGTRTRVLGTAALASGEATLKIQARRVRDRSITVIYGGDADFTPSQSEMSTTTDVALESLARPTAATGHRPRARR
jgi:hypothetical protein